MPTQDLASNFTGHDVSLGSTIAKLAAAVEGLGKKSEESSHRANRSFLSMGSSMGKLHGSMGLLTSGMGGLFGTIAAFNVVSVIKGAADFEASMMRIHTQAGVAKDQIASLSKSVLALAGPTATAPEQLATSLYHLESVGISGAAALNATKIAAQGAMIGNADLESVTNALTATLVSGVKGAQNMGEAMGSLNSIVGAGDMKMQDLAEAFGTGFLASVKTFGISLNDVGAALATFGDANVRGAEAATQLRMAVLFMAKPVASAAPVFAHLGMSMTQMAKDMQSGGLIKALKDLKSHMIAAGDTGVKQGQVLVDAFGHKAGTGLSTLIDQLGRVEAKAKQVGAGAKSFGQDWKDTTETAAYKMKKFHETITALGITIGTNLLPIVAKLADWLGKELPKAIDWAKAAFARIKPLAVQVFQDIMSAVKSLMPMLKSFAEWLISAKAFVVPFAAGVLVLVGAFKALKVIGTVIQAVKMLNLAMKANVIILVVSLIAALVAAFITAWQTSKTFRDTMTQVWKDIEKVVGFVVQKIVEYLRGLVHMFLSYIGMILHGAAAAFGWMVPSLKTARDAFDRFEKTTLDGMQNFADASARLGHDAGANYLNGLKDGLAGHGNHEPGYGSKIGSISYQTYSGGHSESAKTDAFVTKGINAANRAAKQASSAAALQKQLDAMMKGLGASGQTTPGAGAGLDPYGDPLAHGKTKKGPKHTPEWIAQHKRELEALRDIWQAAHKRQLDALKDVQEALKKTAAEHKKMAQAADKAAKDAVAALAAQAKAFAAAVDAFRTAMKDAIQGGAIDISQLILDPNGQNGGLAWLQINLADRLAAVKKFAADLKALAAAGASKDLLAQVAGMGPDQGDQLAQQLITGGSDAIKGVSDQMKQISDAAQSGADVLTKQFYGPGASAIDQLIAGMESQFPKLRKVLAAIAAEVATAMGGPSSTPGIAAAGYNQHAPGMAPSSGVVNLHINGQQFGTIIAPFIGQPIRQGAIKTVQTAGSYTGGTTYTPGG